MLLAAEGFANGEDGFLDLNPFIAHLQNRRCIKEGDLGAKRPAEERGEPLPAKEVKIKKHKNKMQMKIWLLEG